MKLQRLSGNSIQKSICLESSTCSSNRKVSPLLYADDEIKLGIIKHMANIMKVLSPEKR